MLLLLVRSSGIAKATLRTLEKLGLKHTTIVTRGKACALFMKLLICAERLNPQDIERLVLFNAEITTETVNGILVRKNGKGKRKREAMGSKLIASPIAKTKFRL